MSDPSCIIYSNHKHKNNKILQDENVFKCLHPNIVIAAQCEVRQSLTEQLWNFFKPHGQSRRSSDSTPTLSISFHKAALWNNYVQFIITFYALSELMRHSSYIYT